MEEGPTATDEPEKRKLLEDGEFGEYITGPAAQDAFTYGGEAGYLRYVYDEARRRIDLNKMKPSQTIIIGRHDPGSEWPDVSYATVEAEDVETPSSSPKAGTNEALAPTIQSAQSDTAEQGPDNQQSEKHKVPLEAVASDAASTEQATPVTAQDAEAAETPEPIGPDRQLPSADVNQTSNGTVPPQPDQAEAMTPEIIAARDDLRAKREAYAHIAASRRSSSIADLLEGPRLSMLMRRMISPAYRKAVRERDQNNRAREEYKQALDAYLALLPNDESSRVRTKLSQMLLFERSVLRHQQHLTYARSGPNGQPERSFWERKRLELARDWHETGKPQKIGIGALVVAGGAVGVWASFATAPLWIPLFIGGTGATAFIGGAISGRTAEDVNKYWPGTEPGSAEIRARVTEELRRVYGYNRGMKDLPVQHDAIREADSTTTHEQLTSIAAHDNAVRRRNARIGGAVIAGASFFVMDGVISGIRSISQHGVPGFNSGPEQTPAATSTPTPTATPSPTPTPTPTHPPTPTPNTVPTPPAGLGQEYPWDAAMQYNVAHHLSTAPSGVWNTLHNAAAQYNHLHGTNYDYVLQPNGKYWLENGARVISKAQQADFNHFLWQLTHN